MKLIITNASETIHLANIAHFMHMKLITSIYPQKVLALDLPIEKYPNTYFSIQNDTLYYGLQWIGTISTQVNPTTQQEEHTVHLNHRYSQECLFEYAKHLVEQKKLEKELGSLRIAKEMTETTAPFPSTIIAKIEDESESKTLIEATEKEITTVPDRTNSSNISFVYDLNVTFFNGGAAPHSSNHAKRRKAGKNKQPAFLA